MKRLLTALSLATMASTPVIASDGLTFAPSNTAQPSSPSSKTIVRAQTSFTAFEFAVFSKDRMGTPPGAVYASTWQKAMNACDDAGGYITEYHDGYKESFPDTREGAVRMYAYGACKLSQGAGNLSVAAQPDAIVRMESGNLLTSNGRVTATGHLDKAYAAARTKVYESCAVLDRRVRFMSFVYGTTYDGKDQVQVRFACNSAMNASAIGD